MVLLTAVRSCHTIFHDILLFHPQSLSTSSFHHFQHFILHHTVLNTHHFRLLICLSFSSPSSHSGITFYFSVLPSKVSSTISSPDISANFLMHQAIIYTPLEYVSTDGISFIHWSHKNCLSRVQKTSQDNRLCSKTFINDHNYFFIIIFLLCMASEDNVSKSLCLGRLKILHSSSQNTLSNNLQY